jgi:hypothetical protein
LLSSLRQYSFPCVASHEWLVWSCMSK